MILRTALRELRHADPTFGQSASQIPGPQEGWTTWAGVPVDERRALQQLTVHACVALISDTIAQLPIGTFRNEGSARVEAPRWQLLDQPFDQMEWPEWIGAGTVSLLLDGNAYGLITARDSLGVPIQIEPLHPSDVRPRRNRATGRLEYLITGERAPVDAIDVLHVKGFMLPGVRNLTGLSPIAYARQTIATALAAEEYGARYFSEASVPPGYLRTDKPITEDDARRYQELWVRSHGNRSRRPAVLGGGLDFKAISISPQDSQFLETIRAKRSEIAGFYRVPPHMIGDVERSTSWGTGIEEQMLGFVTFTVGIWIIRWERALSRLLPRPRYVKFNLAGLLRGRLTERYRAYVMGRQAGFLSIDEIRALEELEPLPDGKGTDYLAPLNYQAIPPGGLAESQPPAS